MTHIFISYSKKDIDFARHLRRMLQDAHFTVWMDETMLEPSDDWFDEIVRNIIGCAAFIVIMSDNANASKWVKRELAVAEDRDHNKPIFPVLYQGKHWYRLADIQGDDMLAGLNAALSERLVNKLAKYAPRATAPVQPPPPVVQPPPTPTSAQQALQAARTFASTRNTDWKPFVAVFPTLKIPDMRFCLVPVGTFQMGSQDGKRDNEVPQHAQHMTAPYWIAQYPVTNAQWALAVRAGKVPEPQSTLFENGGPEKWYADPAMADAPVVGIDWHAASAFADWVGARLPTEREWEYAARGVESLRYPWGNEWNPAIPVWSENSGGKPAIVTSKPEGVSWVGAHHLIGNVWEWTGSRYEAYPYPADGSREALDNRTGVQYVLRGGSWWGGDTDNLRAACRGYGTPDDWNLNWGLRLALS